eukprot:1180520-Prorocentrum_minimum.AAC.1
MKRGYILTTRTNWTQESWAYSHDGPIGRRKRGYILTTDQSDAGSASIFSRQTNRTQEARVCSHDGPIGRRAGATTHMPGEAGGLGLVDEAAIHVVWGGVAEVCAYLAERQRDEHEERRHQIHGDVRHPIALRVDPTLAKQRAVLQ